MKIDFMQRLSFLSAEHKLWQADCQEEEQQDRHLYRRLHCTARVICFFFFTLNKKMGKND